jgi:hypothetical protein
MIVLATLTLAALSCAPGHQGAAQDPDRPAPKLAPADHKRLGDLAAKWMDALRENDEADSPQKRDRTRRSLQRAKDGFEKEWEKLEKKVSLLASLGDLLPVFQHVFAYERMSGSGIFKSVPGREGSGIPTYEVVLPKAYRAEVPARTLFVVPGYDEASKQWTRGEQHFNATWKDSPLLADTILVSAPIPDTLALDPVPELGNDVHDAEERRRIAALFGPFGEATRTYNLDRDRWVLDCGRAASGFGLRIASYFPDRWAGLILRDPVDVGRIRLETLAGMPVLLIANPANRAIADKLAATLNGFKADTVRVLDGQGDYPYTASTPAIAEWVGGLRRNLYRTRVSLVPNHNQFADAYWARITVMEPLESATEAKRPMLIAEADRAANRITVTATGITEFRLLLNDSLVDLDKEFTVVVNGIGETLKRERSRQFMIDLMKQKFDPGFLFTSFYVTSVKKPAGDTSGDEKKGGG